MKDFSLFLDFENKIYFHYYLKTDSSFYRKCVKRHTSGVYLLRNCVNGKVYVGRSIDIKHRLKEHFGSEYNKTCGSVLIKAKEKYGFDSFDVYILEICEPKDLKEREDHYLDTLNPFTGRDYNIRKDGDPYFPFEIPEEQRIRISNTLKEYYLNNENAFKGKTHTEESRKRISERVKEYKQTNPDTEETIKKRSKASKESGVGNRLQQWVKENGHPRNTAILMLDKDTGEVLREFSSVKEASEIITGSRAKHTSICNCLNGWSKSAFGFSWKYK